MSLKLDYKMGNFALPFQRTILTTLLTDGSALRRFRAVIHPSYFEKESDRSIVEGMLTVFDQTGTPPSLPSLQHILTKQVRDKSLRAEAIERGKVYFKRKVKDVDYVMSQAAEFARVQALANAAITTARDVAQGKSDGIIKRFQDAMRIGEDYTDIGGEYAALLRKRNRQRRKGKLIAPGISTGFPHLDYVLRGGCRKKWLVFFIGVAKAGKCLSSNARVWVPSRGWVRMGDIKQSETVFGIDQATKVPCPTKVSQVITQGRKRIAEIRLRSGRIINGFADTHPVLTWRGWVRTKDLKVGDYVVGSKSLLLLGTSKESDRDAAYVCGVFTGDGGLTDSSPRLHIHGTDDREVLQAVCDRLPLGSYSSETQIEGKGACHNFCTSMWDWLDRRGMTRDKSTNKKAPQWIYSCGNDSAAAFLAGLFDTDGSVSRKGYGVQCEFITASFDLSEDILTLLNCLGIYASRKDRRIKRAGKNHPAWTIYIRDEDSLALFESRVGIYGHHVRKWKTIRSRTKAKARSSFYSRLPADVWSRALKSLGGRSRWHEKTMAGMWRTFSSTLPTAALVFDEVKSVSWVGREQTIDISTEANTQSFLAEHVFTHNSTILLNVAMGASAAGKRVLYVTLELDEGDIYERLDYRIGGPKNVELAHLDPDKFGKMLENRTPMYMQNTFRVKHYTPRTLTCSKLKVLLEALASAGEKIDVLIVDHGDLMVPEDVNRNASRSEREGQVYLELKQLADEQDVLLYTASQANKGANQKETTEASDVAWAYEKIGHCDLAMSLNQTRDEAKEKRGRLTIVAARRHMQDVNVDVHIDRSAYYIKSLGLYDGFMDPIPTPHDKEGGDSMKRKRLAGRLKKLAGDEQTKGKKKKMKF